MKLITINEYQKGLVFKNGKFVKVLSGGEKCLQYKGIEIEIISMASAIQSEMCVLEVLLKNPQFKEMVTTIEVDDSHIALHYVDGRFEKCLTSGVYAYWNEYQKHTFKLIDVSKIDITDEVPQYVMQSISKFKYKKVVIEQHQVARLYYNGKFERLLEAGTYYFWETGTEVKVETVDTRLIQANITGQEILSLDKVSLRINFVCTFKVTDYIKIAEVSNFGEQLHVAAQLAMREFIGRYKVDEILESKEKISAYVLEKLKEKQSQFYIKIYDAGVKDIILPGEIREIMNTVLIAEKRAQANVITRREEVASTRSLLNTAKLMDENKTLYKLKELEYIEKICDRVGNINVSGSGDILSQLTTALKG